MRKVLAGIMTLLLLLFSPIARGVAPLAPQPVECPGSNAHVWDKDQCPRIATGTPGGFPGGGGGPRSGGGLLGVIGRVVRGLL